MSFTKYYIGPSTIQGQGIFARRPLLAGSFIVIAIQDKTITPEFGAYINHSIFPSAHLHNKSKMGQWALLASRDLDEDEEVTADYNKSPPFIQRARSSFV
jgi:SET domain-containing protein